MEWTYRSTKLVPEPKSLQTEMFFPVDPKYIYLVMNLISIKYMGSILFVMTFFFYPTIISRNTFAGIFSISFILDLVLLSLLYASSRDTFLRHKQILAGVVFAITSLLFLAIPVSHQFFPNLVNAVEIQLLTYILIFLFYFIVKEKLVKATDRGQGIYPLAGPSKFLFLGFIYAFVISFLIPFRDETSLWEFHVILIIMVVTYLVFINLWVSGPTEYMDREGLHRLTNLSVFMATLLILSGFVFPFGSQLLSHSEVVIYLIIPIILINLIGKFRGYIFRNRKLVQVATMKVDRELRRTK